MKLFLAIYGLGSLVGFFTVIAVKIYLANTSKYGNDGRYDLTIKQMLFAFAFSWISVVGVLYEMLEDKGFWSRKIFKFGGSK